MMRNPQSSLPPGFRFHPTDEELILHYLKKKVASTPFPLSIIADVDIYKFDPWDLPVRAAFGEKEWYFFSPRDRKYPNGARPNRAAASGYWKATGTDKIITASAGGGGGGGGGRQDMIGVKKALVFYKGRPPKGVKTNWIMHEYRIVDAPTYSKSMKPKDSSMRLDDWVLCRIYKKSHALPPSAASIGISSDQEQEEEAEQFVQETLLPLKTPNLIEKTTLMPQKSCSFSNLLDAMDYSILSSFLSDNPINAIANEPQTLNAQTLDHDQPFFSSSYSNYNPINSNSYLLQKLPQLNDSSTMENKLKRDVSNIIDLEDQMPSKKMVNSCSFINTTGQIDMAQYNFVNQQLLLSPHLQFHG